VTTEDVHCYNENKENRHNSSRGISFQLHIQKSNLEL
jgi:hypothetical protein